MPINDPRNPLYGKEYRGGKSPVKHYYTVQDIARLSGRAVGTVRNDSAAGRVDLDDLGSVCAYIRERAANIARREERISAA